MNPHLAPAPTYDSYFDTTMWSIEAFGALTVGLTPDRYAHIRAGTGESPSNLELYLCSKADETTTKLLKDLIKRKDEYIQLIDDQMVMTCWRYIKWVATSQISVKTKFVEHLPLILIELYLEFQPINEALRTRSRFSSAHHRAQYLEYAKELQRSSPRRLYRREIYDHPRMQRVADGFRDHNGKRKTYSKRVIMNSWLKHIDPQPRGRPKSTKKQLVSK